MPYFQASSTPVAPYFKFLASNIIETSPKLCVFIVMKPCMWILINLIFSLGQVVSAFPGLVARQCDSIVCLPWPSPSNIGDGISGIGGALGEMTNLFRSPDPAESPTPGVVEGTQGDAAPSSAPSADIEIYVVATPTSGMNQKECDPTPAPGSGPDSDPIYFNAVSCEIATAQIVWLQGCENTDQIGVVAGMLNEMERENGKTDGILVSTDPTCAVIGGTSFFLSELTPGQIETVQNTPWVKAVEADIAAEPDDFFTNDSQADEDGSITSSATGKRSILDEDTVVRQKDAAEDLSFLSTGPSQISRRSDDYLYFSTAGAGITVYVIDLGLNPFHDEFVSISDIRWLIALKARKSPSDPDPTAHGTCICSKILGGEYGVVKKPNLVLVKISLRASSVIDAFSKIILDLVQREIERENVKGYTVVNYSGGIEANGDSVIIEQMEKFIRYLVRNFQAVIVTSAGNLRKAIDEPDIIQYPALFSLNYPIITVGAVLPQSGQKYARSLGGPAVTVSAPGGGKCALNPRFGIFGANWQRRSGTSVPAAIVSGLALYFLSLPILGDQLRENANIPAAVKDYILRKAFSRNYGPLAVWNGLDSNEPSPGYGWVL